MSSRLPVQIEAFSFEKPRQITNAHATRNYQRVLDNALKSYHDDMRRVFRIDDMRKILNDSIRDVNLQAYETAIRQTRLDFPGYDLGEEDIQQYRYMGADLFSEVEIRFPSKIDLSQMKTNDFPRLGIRAQTTVKWLDSVEDIDFMMRWVATIDGLWPQILEDMRPKIEDLNVKLKQKRKKIINSMKKTLRMYSEGRNGRLQENKRKIKVLIKK